MGEGEHRDVVAGLLSKISSLQGAAAAAEATRRALHNQMVELRGKASGRMQYGEIGQQLMHVACNAR